MGVGVLLFFVLSGYLISGPFVVALAQGSRLPMLAAYGVRRAARILPAYWVAFATILVVSGTISSVTWWQLPVHSSLLHGWVPGEGGALFFVAWSLSAEAAFYVLLPLTALILLWRWRRIDVSRLALLVGLAWVASWSLPTVADIWIEHHALGTPLPRWVDMLHNSPLGTMGLFCPGILVALATTRQAADRGGVWAFLRWLTGRRVGAAVFLALFALGVVANSRTSFIVVDIGGQMLFSLAFGVLVGVVVQENRETGVLRRLAPIGVVSYGIYLWHYVAQVGITRHAPELVSHGGVRALAANIGLLLLFALPLAIASWFLVERPAIHWAATWARRRRERMSSFTPVSPAEPAAAG
jgi:peptidoglycan/LPS O-acetylase OafA/YrhL